MRTIFGLAVTVFSMFGLAGSAHAAGLTKNAYPTAALAARAEAANQMSRVLAKYNIGGPMHARDLKATRLSRSASGRATRFLVSSGGDIPGDMKISVLKLKSGAFKAYKGGTFVGEK